MSTNDLALDHLAKAGVRVEMLAWLMDRKAYSDVVREAQEAVELALKGVLRAVGIEPPKVHDVGELLVAHSGRFPEESRMQIPTIAAISKSLRKDRELAFYGDVDFVPGKSYGAEDAGEAFDQARTVLAWVRTVLPA